MSSPWHLQQRGPWHRHGRSGHPATGHPATGRALKPALKWEDFPGSTTSSEAPRSIAKLVQITPISLWLIGDITITTVSIVIGLITN